MEYVKSRERMIEDSEHLDNLIWKITTESAEYDVGKNKELSIFMNYPPEMLKARIEGELRTYVGLRKLVEIYALGAQRFLLDKLKIVREKKWAQLTKEEQKKSLLLDQCHSHFLMEEAGYSAQAETVYARALLFATLARDAHGAQNASQQSYGEGV